MNPLQGLTRPEAFARGPLAPSARPYWRSWCERNHCNSNGCSSAALRRHSPQTQFPVLGLRRVPGIEGSFRRAPCASLTPSQRGRVRPGAGLVAMCRCMQRHTDAYRCMQMPWAHPPPWAYGSVARPGGTATGGECLRSHAFQIDRFLWTSVGNSPIPACSQGAGATLGPAPRAPFSFPRSSSRMTAGSFLCFRCRYCKQTRLCRACALSCRYGTITVC